MSLPHKSAFRKLMIWPPLILGAALLYFASRYQPQLEPALVSEQAIGLRVISVPKVDFVPRALGYGVSQPQNIWRAVAEVSGRLSYIHADLKSGVIIRGGTKVLEFEKTEFRLAVERSKADLKRMQNELAELDLREANLEKTLALEERSFKLATDDVERLRKLVDRNAASRSQLDTEVRSLLQQEQKLQAQKHSLSLIPSQRRTLDASIEAQQASIKDAEFDVQKTNITAPFDCRIRNVDFELGQYFNAGTLLLEADGVDAIEVVAQLSIEHATNLIDSEKVDFEGIAALLSGADANSLADWIPVEATVRATAGEMQTSWEARFVNTHSSIDLKTRTIGFVTVVERPYEKVIPGKRPPLLPGVFCEVELRAPPRAGRIVIPRLAIRGDHVLVVNQDSRLERRTVTIDFAQGSVAVVESGISAGDTLVVSDPTPAIDGQLVDPTVDNELMENLLREAVGKEPLR